MSAAGKGLAPQDYERLEFLGDALLGFLAGEFLLSRFPAWSEGELSKGKAYLVSGRSLSEAARRIQLGRFLRLGRGEDKTGGRDKIALLADAYEAVVAAVYFDAGLDAASDFIRRTLLDAAVDDLAVAVSRSDHKSALQEWFQRSGASPLVYRVVSESGPDHKKSFIVEVLAHGKPLATGEGPSKKEAEQVAASRALDNLLASGQNR